MVAFPHHHIPGAAVIVYHMYKQYAGGAYTVPVILESAMSDAIHKFYGFAKDILCCPACGGGLKISQTHFNCAGCGAGYGISGGIPLFFCKHNFRTPGNSITDAVREFYETNPFPNYSGLEDAAGLIERAKEGLFAGLLDEQIPPGARILEAGCGTGQLSNFLGIANRTVFGADLSISSLKLAQGFKEKNSLDNVHFLQMNLFRPAFRPKSFDLVICNGVLHHTPDPSAGFEAIAGLVKDGGYVIMGLYHKYGRIPHEIRRLIFKLSGRRLDRITPRNRVVDTVKRRAWIMDQYANPHESKHTIREALSWFRRTGFEFIRSIPGPGLFKKIFINEKLFMPERLPDSAVLFLSELAMVFTGSADGGLFLIIGRRGRV